MGGRAVSEDRSKGGRRAEDFPAARARDEEILKLLRENRGGLTRNQIVLELGLTDRPRLVTYALARLRRSLRVGHVPEGCEGHGYWKITLKEQER